MKQYVPIEPLINAGEVVSVDVVTTATLDDGSSVVVPNDCAAGDFVVQNADGTFKFVKSSDFLEHFRAA